MAAGPWGRVGTQVGGGMRPGSTKARPRSPMAHDPSSLMSTFWLLRSRWAIPGLYWPVGEAKVEGTWIFFLPLLTQSFPSKLRENQKHSGVIPMASCSQLTHHPASAPHGEMPSPVPGTVPSAGNVPSHWCAGSSSGTGNPGRSTEKRGTHKAGGG